MWHGNYLSTTTNRPQDTVQLDGNSFKGMHELKFGFGWRKSSVSSDSSWPGGLRSLARAVSDGGYPINGGTFPAGTPGSSPFSRVPALYNGHSTYWNGYVGDTITKDRYTFNVGVRWDRQGASSEATSMSRQPA